MRVDLKTWMAGTSPAMTMRSFPPVSGAALLLPAFAALAALGLDEADEVLLAVVVGDLVARRYFLDGADEDLALDDVGLGVRAARVVDVPRDVAPGRAVDGPALVELEQVAVVELVGDLVRDAPAPILDDEIALVDGLGREQAETCLRATDTERATRRNGLHGRKGIAWLANRSGNAPVGSHRPIVKWRRCQQTETAARCRRSGSAVMNHAQRSMRRHRGRAFHLGEAVLHRLLHLLERPHLDLAHALARD